MSRRFFLVFWGSGALLVALWFAASPAVAQSAAGGGWSYEFWHELMSPYCPGRTLADCPSNQAEELRGWIVEQEAAGRDREQVRAELFARFGDVLRAAPAARGVGLVAYVIPVVAFIVGGALAVFFLRRRAVSRAPADTAVVSERTLDPELERLLDREIADSDG